MARFLVGAAIGALVTLVAGAALGIHAQDEADVEAVVDGTQAVAEPDPTPEPAYGVWDRLAGCESTSNWHSASNPIYKGGLQFDASTWARHGGLAYAWRADFATRAQQILIAERTLATQGWSAWPVCSRRLGLRS